MYIYLLKLLYSIIAVWYGNKFKSVKTAADTLTLRTITLCVTDVVKGMNITVLNLMSRTNETPYVTWHETCACKCGLDARVCIDKQRRNTDKCSCECKYLIDKGRCDDEFVWNPIIFECEYHESCDAVEYLDYANCKCRKRIIGRVVEWCDEDIDGSEMVYNGILNDYGRVCKSCTLYIALLIIKFIIL